ncbi:MAG: transporter [Lachnospiraceae bacterium]|nr:transporter [Lachnospiraceae bacterium]
MKIISERVKVFIALHLLLMIYSLGGICSKKAAQAGFLSREFFMYYGMLFLLLGFYAIGWQQVLKKLPLTTAFSNKAVTVAWGMIWGIVFFDEAISVGKIVGIIIVMIGVVLYSQANGGESEA